jgi:hypothetical protein
VGERKIYLDKNRVGYAEIAIADLKKPAKKSGHACCG